MTTGVSETDTVIYISVSFMNSTNVTEETSFDSSLPSLNLLHRSFPSFLGTDTIIRKGDNNYNETEAGLIGDSTEMPTTLSPSNPPSFPPSETEPNLDSRPTCPGTYLASATHCSTDQFDRPVAGILSLCIGNVHNFFHNEEQIQRNKMAVMHEIGHILGFNAMSLAHFRDAETGEPLTRRDENGNEVGIGEPGELCAKGPQVMLGYWNREDVNKEFFTEDGFFRTGDMATVDEKGYFRIVDRKKDMILVSGFNVFPNEVEEVVAACEGVLENACIGIPHELTGESVKIFVVKMPGVDLDEEQIIDYCRDKLTAYKMPKYVEFLDELPKSTVGKILRRELRGD